MGVTTRKLTDSKSNFKYAVLEGYELYYPHDHFIGFSEGFNTWSICMIVYLCGGFSVQTVVRYTSSNFSLEGHGRAGQPCFGLLALISHPQVTCVHLSERMILLGSLIPSD